MALRRVLQLVSWLALAGIVIPPVLFLAGRIDLDQTKLGMLIATVAWFIATPLWMGRELQPEIETEAVI